MFLPHSSQGLLAVFSLFAIALLVLAAASIVLSSSSSAASAPVPTARACVSLHAAGGVTRWDVPRSEVRLVRGLLTISPRAAREAGRLPRLTVSGPLVIRPGRCRAVAGAPVYRLP